MVSLKPGPDGQRRRKKVSGKNKSEVRAKLAGLHDELNDGVVTNAAYTVAQAINDWLTDGLAGRAPKTVSTQREVLEPLIDARAADDDGGRQRGADRQDGHAARHLAVGGHGNDDQYQELLAADPQTPRSPCFPMTAGVTCITGSNASCLRLRSP